TAPSLVGVATTGGTLLIMLCSSGTAKCQVAYGLTNALNQPVPQTSRTAQTMIHGMSEAQTCALVGFAPAGRGGAIVDADSSWLRKAGDVQIFFGRQTCRKPTRHAIDTSEATISTNHGLT